MWYEAKDENGTAYFYNESTSYTTWDRPAELAADWQSDQPSAEILKNMETGLGDLLNSATGQLDKKAGAKNDGEKEEAPELITDKAVQEPPQEPVVDAATEEAPVKEEAPVVQASAEENEAATSLQRIARGKNARDTASNERKKLTRALMTDEHEDYLDSEMTDELQAKFMAQYDTGDHKNKLEQDKSKLLDALASKNFGEVDRTALRNNLAGGTVWIKQYDSSTDSHYYFNSKTGKTQWDKPADYEDNSDAAEDGAQVAGAVKLQSMFRGHKTRGEVEERLVHHREKAKNLWIEQFDPATKKMYYFNSETGKSQTTVPEEYIPGGSDERLTAVLKLQCSWRARKGKMDAVEMAALRMEQEEEHFSRDVLVGAFGKEGARQTRRYAAFNRFQRDKLRKHRKDLERALERLDAMQSLQKDVRACADQLSGKKSCGDGEDDDEDEDEDDVAVEDEDNIGLICLEKIEAIEAAYAMTKNESVQVASMAITVVSFEDVEAQVGKVSATLGELEAALEAAVRSFVLVDEWRLGRARKRLEIPKLMHANGMPVVEAAGAAFAKSMLPVFDRLQRCILSGVIKLAQGDDTIAQIKKNQYAGVVDGFFGWHMAVQDAVSTVDEAVNVAKGIREAVRREKERQQEAKEQKLMFSEERQQKMVERILRIRALQTGQRAKFVQWCRRGWQKGKTLRDEDEDAKKKAKDKFDAEHHERDVAIKKQAMAMRALRDEKQTSPWQAVRDGCSVETLRRLVREERMRRRYQEGELVVQELGRGEAPSQSKLRQKISGKEFHVDHKDHVTGEVLLRNAVWFGHGELVQELLAMGASVHLKDNLINKFTPLHEAARGGFPKICKLLLDSGARADAADGSGDTPLHWASRRGLQQVVNVLLASEPHDSMGMSPMWRSVIKTNNRGRSARDLSNMGKPNRTISMKLMRYESQVGEKMREEQDLQASAEMRAMQRRSKNLSVLDRSQGTSYAEEERGMLESQSQPLMLEGGASLKRSKKKKKTKKLGSIKRSGSSGTNWSSAALQ